MTSWVDPPCCRTLPALAVVCVLLIACGTADGERAFSNEADASAGGAAGASSGATGGGGSAGAAASAGHAGEGGSGGGLPDDFGLPCDGPSDCSSELCVEGPDGKVCTISCSGACPADFECVSHQSVIAPGQLCMPQLARLCRPCADDADCQREGVTDDAALCVPYGDEGAFCGVACSAGSCPEDFRCEAVTVGGPMTQQCVPDEGLTCDCRPSWADEGYETACAATNPEGSCPGHRSCQAGGLSACSAPEPIAESCNGTDDDCDGSTDEDTCDDGHLCTEDRCMGASGCENPLVGANCLIDDTCLVDGIANPVNACEVCDPAVSKTSWTAVSGACDDGLSCTTGDTCSAGVCTGTPQQDGNEPNDTSDASMPLSGTSDCDDFPKGSVSGTVFGPGDEDWYSYHISDDYFCWIYPRARLNVPDGSDHELCAYFVCDDGSMPSLSCLSGTLSEAYGMRGCCSESAGSVPENAELNHECSGSDDAGWMYVRVFNGSGSYTCDSYVLDYGDGEL